MDDRTVDRQNKRQTIARDFKLRQNRQLVAIAVTIVLMVVLALLSNRPDLLGGITRNAVIGGQLGVVLGFVAFSAYNWRCPSCHRYLGRDIYRSICRHCGERLHP